mmetsp:Transcript_79254/g.242490  ORF Transcript_79254/g.242490 Transcript_79254/m.242490 type:complete len:228 (+) Transcript_79254:506-1189(+)
MAVHHLFGHAAAEREEVDQTEGFRLDAFHGLTDETIHDLEILVVPPSVGPRKRLHIATQTRRAAARRAKGPQLCQRGRHLVFEFGDGFGLVHSEQLLPRAILFLSDSAHVVPRPNLDDQGDLCLGPHVLHGEQVHCQVDAGPKETQEHGDSGGLPVVRRRGCQHFLDGRATRRVALRGHVSVHLPARRQLIVDRGPMCDFAVLDNDIHDCGRSHHCSRAVDVVLVRR